MQKLDWICDTETVEGNQRALEKLQQIQLDAIEHEINLLEKYNMEYRAVSPQKKGASWSVMIQGNSRGTGRRLCATVDVNIEVAALSDLEITMILLYTYYSYAN